MFNIYNIHHYIVLIHIEYIVQTFRMQVGKSMWTPWIMIKTEPNWSLKTCSAMIGGVSYSYSDLYKNTVCACYSQEASAAVNHTL